MSKWNTVNKTTLETLRWIFPEKDERTLKIEELRCVADRKIKGTLAQCLFEELVWDKFKFDIKSEYSDYKVVEFLYDKKLLNNEDDIPELINMWYEYRKNGLIELISDIGIENLKYYKSDKDVYVGNCKTENIKDYYIRVVGKGEKFISSRPVPILEIRGNYISFNGIYKDYKNRYFHSGNKTIMDKSVADDVRELIYSLGVKEDDYTYEYRQFTMYN